MPGAAAPGQARAGERPGYTEAASLPTYIWQLQWVPRRSRLRGVLGALVAVALLVAVPVVSAYVAYKLASGENPFEWPPTVDWDRVVS